MALYKYVDLTGLGHFKDKILVESIIESGPNANITETNKAPSVKATYDYIQDEISDVVDQMTTALSTKLSSVNYDSVNKKITATNGGTKDVVTVATLRNDMLSTMEIDNGTPILIGGGGSSTQSNWDETDPTAPDFIKNKPTIPTAAVSISQGETGYATGDQVYSYSEDKSNKITSIDSSSTDIQYPSAKAVYDAIEDNKFDPSEMVEVQEDPNLASSSRTATVTISDSDWSNLTCTKNVTGMTADKNVIVSPNTSSADEWSSSGVQCTAQGSGTLTFTCVTVPSTSVVANILIL